MPAGGGSLVNTKNFGRPQFVGCERDQDATILANHAAVNEGTRGYTEDDLRSDLDGAIRKFVGRSGIGLRTVAGTDLSKGVIRSSPHRDTIFRALAAGVIGEHEISGTSDRGFHVREEAAEAVRFYAANNVFTGALRQVLEELKEELSL